MGITRARIVLACVVAAVSVALVVTPSAMAAATTKKQERRQNTAISKAGTAIKGLKKSTGILAADLKHAQGQVDVLVALSDALPPILTQLGDGLNALKAALESPTGGLIGLNNARPQFGAWDKNGTFIDGTGAHPPGVGPNGNATKAGTGTYILNFNNNVASRFMVLTLFPTGGVGLVGSAVNCSASTKPCGTDTSPDHILVLWQSSTTAAPTDPANGFEVAAISG
jgi:hypothetical protein